MTPQPVLEKAKVLYILEGEVTSRTPMHLSSLRAAIPAVPGKALWLVVRVETLRWSPQIYADLLARLSQWKAAGNAVAGVQIDFDARTRHLDEYQAFLLDLRHRLPKSCGLSVTGLLDWSANGDPQKLRALSTIVDEVVLQTYQGRATIPGYEKYLARLERFPIPFRIGLVQNGQWREPTSLRLNPRFKGYVVFLINPLSQGGKGRALRH